MDPRPPAARSRRSSRVYLAGDAANYFAPGGVAGEPLKARLLSGSLGAGPALATVTLHKHVDLLAQVVFVARRRRRRARAFSDVARGARAARSPESSLLGAMLGGFSWALRRGTLRAAR